VHFIHVAYLWMCILFFSSVVCISAFAYVFKSKVHCGSAVRLGRALPNVNNLTLLVPTSFIIVNHSSLVDVTFAYRGLVGGAVKKNPEQVWQCLFGILFDFSDSFSNFRSIRSHAFQLLYFFSWLTSVFPFFPILIVEENVCNTPQQICDGLD